MLMICYDTVEDIYIYYNISGFLWLYRSLTTLFDCLALMQQVCAYTVVCFAGVDN